MEACQSHSCIFSAQMGFEGERSVLLNHSSVSSSVLKIMNRDKELFSYTVPIVSKLGWTLFVTLPPCCSERTLRSAFEPYGNITSLECPIDREFGGSQGFALITYKDKANAAMALRDLDESEVCDGAGTLTVNWAYTEPAGEVDEEEEDLQQKK
jgi:RNA recognition motif-containing protein